MSNLDQLNSLLQLIESVIDPARCTAIDERYRNALTYEEVDRPPLVVQPKFGSQWALPKPWDEFRRYTYREAFENPAAMMQNMLLDRVVTGLITNDDSPLAVRNDHGTIQIASLLGGQWHFHGDNYPWVGALGSTDAIRELVESDTPIDWNGGVLHQSTETLKFYRRQLRNYPKCQQAVQISLPDLQGPIDTADILWGSEIFLEILGEPELVSALMAKIVDTMTEVANYYREFTVDRLDPVAITQHGYYIPGRMLIRNDSAIMVSPATYREMLLPQDRRLVKEMAGGSLHFCGNGEHLIEPMLEIPELGGIDLGEPFLMDVKRIYQMCSQKQVPVTNLMPSRENLVTGRAADHYPTGAVLVYLTDSIEDACEVCQKYYDSAD